MKFIAMVNVDHIVRNSLYQIKEAIKTRYNPEFNLDLVPFYEWSFMETLKRYYGIDNIMPEQDITYGNIFSFFGQDISESFIRTLGPKNIDLLLQASRHTDLKAVLSYDTLYIISVSRNLTYEHF